MSHRTLEKYYRTIFMMVQHYNYSISELENLYSFELDIYYSLLKRHLKDLENQSKGLQHL